MMIINLKSEKWWKKRPPKDNEEKVDFKLSIPSGIFFIDKNYCKKHVVLTSNNKSNELIENKYLYMMLRNCIENQLYLPFPEANDRYSFNILSAFKPK